MCFIYIINHEASVFSFYYQSKISNNHSCFKDWDGSNFAKPKKPGLFSLNSYVVSTHSR